MKPPILNPLSSSSVDVRAMRNAILRAAEQEGLSLKDGVQHRLETARSDELVRAYIDEFFSRQTVGEQELAQRYERYVKDLGTVEYELSILTVRTCAEADLLSREFLRLQNFGALAARYSIDCAARAGGYIGWIAEGCLSKVARQSLKAVLPRRMTAPLPQTEGVHLLYYEDSRPLQPRPLDAVRKDLEMSVVAERFNTYLLGERML
jgi:hypothetical protein